MDGLLRRVSRSFGSLPLLRYNKEKQQQQQQQDNSDNSIHAQARSDQPPPQTQPQPHIPTKSQRRTKRCQQKISVFGKCDSDLDLNAVVVKNYMNVDAVPEEIWLHIFGFISSSAKDLTSISKVCRRFHEISKHDDLWKQLLIVRLLRWKYEDIFQDEDEDYSATLAKLSPEFASMIEDEVTSIRGAVEEKHNQNPKEQTYFVQYHDALATNARHGRARSKRVKDKERTRLKKRRNFTSKLLNNNYKMLWQCAAVAMAAVTLFTVLYMLKSTFFPDFVFIPYTVTFIPLYVFLACVITISIIGHLRDALWNGDSGRSIVFSTHNLINVCLLGLVVFLVFVNIKLEVDVFYKRGFITDVWLLDSHLSWFIVFSPLFCSIAGITALVSYEFLIRPLRRSKPPEILAFGAFIAVVALISVFSVLLMVWLILGEVYPQGSPLPLAVVFIPLWIFEICGLVSTVFYLFYLYLMDKERSQIGVAAACWVMFCVSMALFHVLTCVLDPALISFGPNGSFNARGLSMLVLIAAELFLSGCLACTYKNQ